MAVRLLLFHHITLIQPNDDDDDDYDGDGDSGGEYFDGQSTQEAMVIDKCNSADLCHDLHVGSTNAPK